MSLATGRTPERLRNRKPAISLLWEVWTDAVHSADVAAAMCDFQIFLPAFIIHSRWKAWRKYFFRLFGCHGYIRNRTERVWCVGFHCRWEHMEFFSHQDYTNWGVIRFTKGNEGVLERRNIAVHDNVNFHTYNCSLLIYSYAHKSNHLTFRILMLSKSLPASQTSESPQGSLCLPFIFDKLLWTIGKLDKIHPE